MSTKFIVPSSNPDSIGRFAVSPGTPDQVIELPNVGGVVTLNSQITGGDDLLNVTSSFAVTASYALGGPGVGGGGLSGTQYIYVAANGTDTQNAAELQAAYDAAKLLSPTGTNRITIVAAPGNYNFESTPFVMDTEFIDLVPLSDGSTTKVLLYYSSQSQTIIPGISNIVFNSSDPMGTIVVNTNNALVKGVDVLSKPFIIADYWTESPISFDGSLQIEDCSGGDNSFGSQIAHPTIPDAGTMTGDLWVNFTNCKGRDYSFAASSLPNIAQPNGFYGTLKNCAARDYSFFSTSWVTSSSDVLGNAMDVRATDCKARDYSWGYYCEQQNSTFTKCEGENYSFGYGGAADGEYRWCYAQAYSFGAYGNASGYFFNCRAAEYSFGYGGNCSGRFFNCISNQDSFGANGTLTGKLFYCNQLFTTFPTPTSTGKIVLCIDGNDNIVNETA